MADSFSDQVVKYKIMECTPEARIHTVDRSHPNFTSFQTHLGTLAIVLEVTLQLTDAYYLEWKSRLVGSLEEFARILKGLDPKA